MKNDKELAHFLFKNEKYSFHKNYLFIFISLFLSLVTIMISISIFKYIILNYEYNIEYRTLTVYKNIDKVGFENYNDNKEKYLNELLHMKHVIGVYDSDDYEIQGEISGLDDYDGSVSIIGLQDKTLKSLFKISSSELKNNKMICPTNFIPDSSIYDSNEKQKNSLSILGKDLSIDFIKYVNEQSSEKLTKAFIIYDTYSSEQNYQYNNVCYTSEENLEDVKKSVVNYTDPNEGISSFVVLIDNYKNMEETMDMLSEKDYISRPSFSLDVLTINVITLVCISIFILSFSVLYINIKSIVKKYLNNNTTIIFLLSALGFDKDRIYKLYIKKIIMLILILSLVVIFLIFLLSYLTNRYILVFSLVQGLKIYYNSILIVIIILIILLLIYTIIKLHFKKIFEMSISYGIKENI